jgi:dihydrofolate reductase
MISIIVAIAENNVIGKENKLIWYLPKDLKHFKETTTGHYIIQGRKTFESFGKPLPNRTTVIITRNKNYKAEGCIVVNSLQEALDIAINEKEVFIIGGGEVYKQAMTIADRIYLTKVHQSFEGDTFFPEINMKDWNELSRQDFEPDEKNKYPFSTLILERRK